MWSLSGGITPGLNKVESKGNEKILHVDINRTLIVCESYASAKILLVYSSAQVNSADQ